MDIIKNFGIGTVILGFAILLPEINSMFIDFTKFSPSELALMVLGLLMLSFHYFVKPAFRKGY